MTKFTTHYTLHKDNIAGNLSHALNHAYIMWHSTDVTEHAISFGHSVGWGYLMDWNQYKKTTVQS